MLSKICRAAYQPYKFLLFIPFLIINTALFAFAIVLVCQKDSRYGGKLARIWARINTALIPVTVRKSGAENYNTGSSYVVVANHKSQFDIPLLYGWLLLDLKWVMKKELRNTPFIGMAAVAMDHVMIDRSDRAAAMATLAGLKEKFTHGKSVLFFPEGTRSQNGDIMPFKKGAFSTAKLLDLPILPITIIGSEKVLPNQTIDLMPGKAELIIHAPIPVEKVREMGEIELAELSREIIASHHI